MATKTINPGEFDTLVKIQSVTAGRGTQGQRTVSYVDHSTPFAKIERGVDETVQDGNLEASQNLTLTGYKIAAMTTPGASWWTASPTKSEASTLSTVCLPTSS